MGIEDKPIFVYDARLRLLRLELFFLPFYGICIGEIILTSVSLKDDSVLLDFWMVTLIALVIGTLSLIFRFYRKARRYEFYEDFLRAYYNLRQYKDIPYSQTRHAWERDSKDRQMYVIRADSGNGEDDFACHLYDQKIDSNMTRFDWLKIKFG